MEIEKVFYWKNFYDFVVIFGMFISRSKSFNWGSSLRTNELVIEKFSQIDESEETRMDFLHSATITEKATLISEFQQLL